MLSWKLNYLLGRKDTDTQGFTEVGAGLRVCETELIHVFLLVNVLF